MIVDLYNIGSYQSNAIRNNCTVTLLTILNVEPCVWVEEGVAQW